MPNARQAIKPLKNIIKHLEAVSTESDKLKPSKMVDIDYKAFAKNTDELLSLIPALDQLIEARNIEELRKFNEQYPKYAEFYENFYYLNSITEEWLFTNYL